MIPNPLANLIPGSPEKLEGFPYGGGVFGIAELDDDSRSFSGWLSGFEVKLTEDDKGSVSAVLEYARVNYGDGLGEILSDGDFVTVGLMFRFK